MHINAVLKSLVLHMTNKAMFCPKKQTLCITFRVFDNDQPLATNESVHTFAKIVHGGNANHGIILTTQPWN